MRSIVLDQPIDIYSPKEVEYVIKTTFINPKSLRIITLNPEMVVNALDNIEFQAALNNANLIVPDGTGIILALRLNGINDIKRIPGIELADYILFISNELSRKVAIFGGEKNVLDKAVFNLRQKYAGINFVQLVEGYKGQENDELIASEIAETMPDVVLVALGTPRQEIWINKYSSLFPKSIMIGVGGSLDVWSGKKKRAPFWIRDRGFEWLYRVFTEPKRTIRILRTLPYFLWMLLKEYKAKSKTARIAQNQKGQ